MNQMIDLGLAITRQTADEAFRKGNNAGTGFDPCLWHVDIAAEEMGVVLFERAYDHVAVTVTSDGRVIALGGDHRGEAAWAVDITDEVMS